MTGHLSSGSLHVLLLLFGFPYGPILGLVTYAVIPDPGYPYINSDLSGLSDAWARVSFLLILICTRR